MVLDKPTNLSSLILYNGNYKKRSAWLSLCNTDDIKHVKSFTNDKSMYKCYLLLFLLVDYENARSTSVLAKAVHTTVSGL